MPNITVIFYGPARDLAGAASIRIDVADRETVGQLAGRLANAYPKLGRAAGIRLAVNRAYAPMDRVLAEGDEIAVIPPVSGGSADAPVQLTTEPIDVPLIAEHLAKPQAGALLTFLGVVRAERSAQKRLRALQYHAHEQMALEQMQRIRRLALENHEILDAAIVHRLGELAIGETSILVAVVSAHRAAAFPACRWIVDQIKLDVPIWKMDLWEDGSTSWVDPNQQE